MKKFLNDIRSAENPIPLFKQIINTVYILFIGIILGTFSKFIDTMPTNELPFIFEFLDMRNFLGRFALWPCVSLFIAILPLERRSMYLCFLRQWLQAIIYIQDL